MLATLHFPDRSDHAVLFDSVIRNLFGAGFGRLASLRRFGSSGSFVLRHLLEKLLSATINLLFVLAIVAHRSYGCLASSLEWRCYLARIVNATSTARRGAITPQP